MRDDNDIHMAGTAFLKGVGYGRRYPSPPWRTGLAAPFGQVSEAYTSKTYSWSAEKAQRAFVCTETW